MTTIRRLALGAAFVAAAIAAPAAALHKVATYTGVITSGSDSAGLFGAAGSDLAGVAFTTVYTYDTKLGTRHKGLPVYDQIDGGTATLKTNPLTSATLTIAGVTRAAALDFYGIVALAPATHLSEHEVVGDYYYHEQMYNFIYPPVVPSLDANVPTTAGSGGGLFTIGFGGMVNGKPDTLEASGMFDTRSVTITGSVPEPASWALLLAGFAAVGGTMRRRASLAA